MSYLFDSVSLRAVVHVETRQNPIVNRLNKTKIEKQVDHEQERIDRIKAENAVKRTAAAAKACFLTRTALPFT
jgi:hypothetical protein